MSLEPIQAPSLARRDAVIAACLAAAWLAFTAPWIYRAGFAEHDCFSMAAGIRQARLGGGGLGEPLLYFPAAQPLYYLIFIRWPGAGADSLDGLIGMMNHASWLAMGLGAGFVFLLGRLIAPARWAAVGAAVVLANQTWFEMSTYGHPTSLALPLAAGGALPALALLRRPELGRGGAAALAFWAACFAAAFYLRVDVVLFVPVLLGVAAAAALRPMRAVSTLSLAAAPALIAFPLLRYGREAAGVSPASALAGALAAFAGFNPGLAGYRWALAAGVGTVMAAPMVAVVLIRSRNRRALVAAALMIGPPLVTCAINPQPSRRFLPVIVAGGLLVAFAGAMADGRRRGDSAAGYAAIDSAPAARRRLRNPLLWAWLIPLVNLVAPTALDAVARSGLPGAANIGRGRLRHSAFDNHRARQGYLDWDRRRWDRLLAEPPEGSLLIGRWLELAGLFMNASRGDAPVRSAIVSGDGDPVRTHAVVIGARRFLFAEWYPELAAVPAAPTGPAAVFILAPYPDADIARLPPGEILIPPPEIQHRAF